jgi:O-antigen/teichoic acid export membrane protein
MKETRFSKSLMNAKINLIFYFIGLFLSFFSRKIFLDSLSADFMGLIGTLGSVLSFLNLAELGIGQAIGYVLYKPLYDHDRKKINEIISVFGYLYSRIGFLILLIGIIISCFFPLIFGKSHFPLAAIYFAFYSFLISSLLSYFLNYRETLLGADQKNYVVTAYFQTAGFIKTIIQIAAAYYTHNYYYWIAIELVFGFIASFILNWKINQVYPWLKSEVKLGKKIFDKYPEVMKYTKQLFVHKIASFIQFQTDSILIYAFVSLKYVALYGNYTVIISKLALLINNILDGTSAGIGNLIAEGNRKNTIKVYWELTSIRYFFAGVMAFALYTLVESFISLWIGKQYILDNTVFLLIIINTYIGQTRGANDLFLYGYGLFSDTWAPCVEGIINVGLSIAIGCFYGLTGILIGTTVSLLLIICIWKPYFLFHNGIKEPLYHYWFKVFKLLAIVTVSWVASTFIIKGFIHINPYTSFINWTAYALIITLIFGIILFGLQFIFEQGTRDLYHRITEKVFAKFTHK